MIPYPRQTLTDIAVRIATHLMPATSSSYAQADSGLVTALLLTLAQDFERAIFNRMADIDEVKSLCSQIRDIPASDRAELPSQSELDDFARQLPGSLMFADVNALHARAFEILIGIHSWAEAHHPDMALQVWELLRRHSERNKFDIPGP